MAELTLIAATPLDGLALEFDGVALSEQSGRALVSVAIPNGSDAALAERIRNAYGAEIPAAGKSSVSDTDGAHLLGMARDQIFVLFVKPEGDPVAKVEEHIGGAAYLVDQSDSWVMLVISGERARAALERLCPLDLHPDSFAVGDVARTVFEHHASIVFRSDAEQYLLLSPRSSAGSFAHAVQTACESVS